MTETNAADRAEQREASGRVSRREVLRATAVAGVGSGGLAGGSDSASASEITGCDDWLDAPADYPEVDLTSSTPTSDGDTIADEAELVVSVHGWLGRDTSTDQAYTLDTAFEEVGYDEPTIAASWEANTRNYWRAEARTETAGQRLASWLESDQVDVDETTVRLVGHSLGGRVCLETLTALSNGVTVDTIALAGTAVDDNSVCTAGQYATGMSAADEVYNYHSENDDSVCYGYDIQSRASGLGCAGADCSGGILVDDSGETPDHYTDVDVTDEVDDHCAYLKPDVGSVSTIVDAFE